MPAFALVKILSNFFFARDNKKKKFDNILTNAKAGTPYPKNFNALDVNSTSSF